MAGHVRNFRVDREAIANRQRLVAAMAVRGLKQREIVAGLAEQRCFNPRTGAPWSLGIINRDLQDLEEQWRREASGAIAGHKAKALQRLEEVIRLSFAEKDLGMVLAAVKQQRELLGLDAPKLLDIDANLSVGPVLMVPGIANDPNAWAEASREYQRKLLEERSSGGSAAQGGASSLVVDAETGEPVEQGPGAGASARRPGLTRG